MANFFRAAFFYSYRFFVMLLVYAVHFYIMGYTILKGATDVHVILSGFGYAVMWTTMLTYQMARPGPWDPLKACMILTIVLVLQFVGLFFHFKRKGFSKNIHALLGLLSILALISTTVIGWIYYGSKDLSYYCLFNAFANATLAMSSFAAISGIYLERFRLWYLIVCVIVMTIDLIIADGFLILSYIDTLCCSMLPADVADFGDEE